MTSFKLRFRRRGGHVHVAMWSSAGGPESTHGKNGELVFREAEWTAFREHLDAPIFQFIEETDDRIGGESFVSTCISREGEYGSHGDLVDGRCVRCGDEVDVELNTDYEGPDDEEKLLTMSSGTAKMRITGRMTRIASLTAELTKLYAEQHEDMRVLKAKADAYDKMVRLLRSAP